MEKYSDYIILHGANATDLSEEVKQYLKDGWIVLGAPFSHTTETGAEVCQALIKPDTIRPGSIGFNR
jgi:hypothetical protein